MANRGLTTIAAFALLGCFDHHRTTENAQILPDARTDRASTDRGIPVDGSVNLLDRLDVNHPEDVSVDAPVCLGRPLDILFVVDDSQSMEEEQDALADRVRAMLTTLVHPPDMDEDGQPDFEPVRDIQMGVLSSSLQLALMCDEGQNGLRTVANPHVPGCHLFYPEILSFQGGDDAALQQTSTDVGCLLRVGTQGCPIEQPLKSMGNLLQHPGAFLRDNSLLAIILFTDEDDCSLADKATLYGARSEGSWPACLDPIDHLVAVEAYANQLRELRPLNPGLVFLSTVAGVPVDLVEAPAHVDYDALLADSRMQLRRDPSDPLWGIGPACVGANGRAYPARRLVALAAALADQTFITSICEPAFDALAREIGRRVDQNRCSDPCCSDD